MKSGMNEPDTSGYDLWGLSDCYHICENVIMKDGQRSGSRHLVEQTSKEGVLNMEDLAGCNQKIYKQRRTIW